MGLGKRKRKKKRMSDGMVGGGISIPPVYVENTRVTSAADTRVTSTGDIRVTRERA